MCKFLRNIIALALLLLLRTPLALPESTTAASDSDS